MVQRAALRAQRLTIPCRSRAAGARLNWARCRPSTISSNPSPSCSASPPSRASSRAGSGSPSCSGTSWPGSSSARTCRFRSSPIRSPSTRCPSSASCSSCSRSGSSSAFASCSASAPRSRSRRSSSAACCSGSGSRRVASSAGRTRESLFAGAIIAISSTTIIAKAFEEQGITGKLRELVVGVLIVEDLIAILLMATLTAIATGAGLSPLSLARTTARLGAFLVALVVVGLLARAARDAAHHRDGPARGHHRREHGALLRDGAARARARLLGRARRLHRRLARRGVRRGADDRAARAARPRRVRRRLLRVGGHDDRPRAHREALAPDRRDDVRGGRRQDRQRRRSARSSPATGRAPRSRPA